VGWVAPLVSFQGGESVYGRPFKDEFHQRLKFTHRGQVAMASGGPNDNGSQFFITLDKCEHLNRKNTIFGKVTGNTIFNVLQMGERPVDGDDRPEEPIRIRKTETLSCPFDDIVIRNLKPKVVVDEDKNRKRKRKVKGTKNFSLISFGDEAEEDEIETNQGHAAVGPIKSSIVADPTRSDREKPSESSDESDAAPTADSSETGAGLANGAGAAAADASAPREHARPPKKKAVKIDDLDDDGFEAHMRAKVLASKGKAPRTTEVAAEAAPVLLTREGRIEASRLEAKQLQEQLRADREQKDELPDIAAAKPTARSEAQRFLDEQARRYEPNRDLLKSKQRRQNQTIELLSKFKNKLSASIASRLPDDEDEDEVGSDEDTGWMGHRLEDPEFDKFQTVGIDPSLDPNTLSIIDPRNPMNKRRREKSEKKHRSRDNRR
jgi:peptidyl-prolyl cis-trans isomerase SDCCAG10